MKKKQPKKYQIGGDWKTTKVEEQSLFPNQNFQPSNQFQSSWNISSPVVNNPMQTILPSGDILNNQNGNVSYKVDPNQQSQITPVSAANTVTTQKRKVFGDIGKPYQVADALMTGTTFLANEINNAKLTRDENKRFIKELQPKYSTNDTVINDQPIYFQNGGNVSNIIEAEQGEAYMDNNGGVNVISNNAPTHNEGGVNLANVDRVLENTSSLRKDKTSEKLLISPERFEQLFGIQTKKSFSHAEALKEAAKHFSKETNKITNKLKQTTKALDLNNNDTLAQNSLDFNTQALNSVPTEQYLFDTLFNHQEQIKMQHNITNDGKSNKYGGYIPKYEVGGGFEFSSIRQVPKGQKEGKDYYGKVTNKDFNDLKAAHPNYNWQNFNPKSKTDVLNFQQWFNNQAASQGSDYKLDEDGKLGEQTVTARIRYKPNFNVQEQSITPVTEDNSIPVNASIVNNNQKQFQPQSNFKLINKNQSSEFYQPLEWYDLGSTEMNLLDSGRYSTKYNPAEISKIKLKQYNPEPALEQGRRDYNAVLNTMGNFESNQGNRVNAFSQKYNIDNQIIGDYANKNVGIENQERLYNANASDRQSASDQQSRENFERKFLMSIEAERQQKFKAFDDLFNKIAENRKYNREGNLLMKMFPDFDQYGNKNQNQRYFTTDGSTNNSNGMKFIMQTDPNTGQRFRILLDDKGNPVNSSKITPDTKAIGAKKK